jgi:hypothetical protein
MARAEKTVVLNVRVSERQAEWLRKVADDQHSGNLSEAVRRAITDSWVFRRVRDEYRSMREHDGFSFPRDEHGLTRPIELFLGWSTWDMTWDDEDVQQV